jgi:hypothetical protein
VHLGNDIDIIKSVEYNHPTDVEGYSVSFSSASLSLDYNQYLFTAPILVTYPYTTLSFWHMKHYFNPDLLEWGISNTTDPASFTWTPVTLDNTDFQKTSIDLSEYIGDTVFVGFHYYGESSWVYLDDIGISYDYPDAVPVTIGEGEDAVTITVSGGDASNYPSEEIPDIPNDAFVSVGSFYLELIGEGPWTVTIETNAPWGAYYKGGEWHEVQAEDREISFTVDNSKELAIPIILGDVDPTLPVTLASFTAVLTSDLHVNIAWIAESETNHAGYNLLRSEVKELSTALRINDLLISEGTASGTQMSYIYTDSEVYHDATYYYWLESVSLSGETEYFGPITVYINANGEGPGIPEIPLETKLYSAFPNPFNPSTNLRYSMKEAGDVRIDVYNVKGQLMKTFNNSHSLPGYYQVNWDGRDLSGRPASTGVYFYRMTTGNYSTTRKMVLAK